MNLYIAEKPSLARAIAQALPKPHKTMDGFIVCGNSDHVSWCVGHLLESAQPDAYDAKYKKWQMDHLPIVPVKWKLSEKQQTKKQLSVLRKLVKQTTQIIHAGDPDREGQLLVDQVIHHLPMKDSLRKQAQRCLISDLTASAVAKSLQNLQPNQNFASLSTCALARTRADWLFGINLSRAFTLQGQIQGSQTVLSVGRVQTPILGLVVKRDADIEQHRSATYFEVEAHVNIHSNNTIFKWQPSEHCQDHMNDENQIINPKLAQNVASRIINQSTIITKNKIETKQQSAPQVYNLSALQIDCAKRFKYSAQTVLDTCQSLYEKHKLITYPRSDNRFLPFEHYQQRHNVFKSFIHNINLFDQDLCKKFEQADLTKQPKCFNDKKIGAHHGIIPTVKSLRSASLSQHEKNIYQMIARQYAMQFFDLFQSQHQNIECEIQKGIFKHQRSQCVQMGWKTISVFETKKDDADILKININDEFTCTDAQVLEKHTQPPQPFTDATLLKAITGISRFVSDQQLKSVLKETDGIGTEATRASIIELLFKRGYLIRSNNKIRATDLGKALIANLPEHLAKPDLTAKWEIQLKQIENKEFSYNDFIGPLCTELTELVSWCHQPCKQAYPVGPKNNVKRFKKKTGSGFKKRKAS
ncbi:DNA topoisomerase III [Marinicellulosiphila megalodicopiae]|uniref:DNA topoisomerase III n=1 Tax=Marinicellulosiphila megalodicopiae TaxID=2724896 RepID=UPI003BAE362F